MSFLSNWISIAGYGLTKKYIKFFWDTIASIIVLSFHYSYTNKRTYGKRQGFL